MCRFVHPRDLHVLGTCCETLLPSGFGRGVAVDVLPLQVSTQHRPVRIDLDTSPVVGDFYRWVAPPPIQMGAWSAAALADFDRHLAPDTRNLDAAWEVWAHASGSSQPYVQSSQPWGGWSYHGNSHTLHGLFKEFRRLTAACTRSADDHAFGILDQISTAVSLANERRLKAWQAATESRSGAARWIRSKMADRAIPVLPSFEDALFDANQVACKLAHELSTRWNAGVFHFPREGETYTWFVDGSRPNLHQRSPSPAARTRSPIDLSLFDNVPLCLHWEGGLLNSCFSTHLLEILVWTEWLVCGFKRSMLTPWLLWSGCLTKRMLFFSVVLVQLPRHPHS